MTITKIGIVLSLQVLSSVMPDWSFLLEPISDLEWEFILLYLELLLIKAKEDSSIEEIYVMV